MEQAEEEQVTRRYRSLYDILLIYFASWFHELFFIFLVLWFITRIVVIMSGIYKPIESWQLRDQSLSSKRRNCSTVFTLREMEEATCSFSEENLVGKGGFGRVYKGTLRNGEVCESCNHKFLFPSYFCFNENITFYATQA